MPIDHLVINVLRNMDDAAAIFAGLGFALTPRGHHSLGSINHLMMTPGAYLELVGVPETGPQRKDVLDSPLGLSGLVFRIPDADATHARLSAAGFAPRDPILLERPVDLPDGTHMARFRNVRMTANEFPAGRVYFCHHLTPELVWRSEWLTHPNGFRALSGLTLQSPDPEPAARNYAALIEAQATRDGTGWVIRDGDFTIRIIAGDSDAFTEATLDFDNLDTIAARAAEASGASWQPDGPSAGLLHIAAATVQLRCRAT